MIDKSLEKTEYSAKELRDFGLLMAGMLMLMFGVVLPWLFTFAIPVWPFVAALGFVVVSFIKPLLLGPVNRIWLKISSVLAWINTYLIMGIIFFLLVVPIGLIMRLFTADPLNKQCSESMESYRITTKVRNKNHLEKPF